MTDTPSNDTSPLEDDEVAAVALTIETESGEETLAVPVRAPADAERVMDILAGMDDVLADIDPEIQDAVTAALILAMGNALRQAPEWPVAARLDSFGRFVQSVIDDVKTHLDA